MPPKGKIMAAPVPPQRRRRYGDFPDGPSKRRKEDQRPSEKEEIDDVVAKCGVTKKEAREFVKQMRRTEQAVDTSAGRKHDDSTPPLVSHAAAGDDAVDQTRLQDSSTAQAAAAAGDNLVHKTRLQDSSTAQAAAADKPQHDEPGVTASEGMPVKSTPDLSRFFNAGAGGRVLPPATQLTICPEATSAEVTRLPAPAPASFPAGEDASSSIEDEGEASQEQSQLPDARGSDTPPLPESQTPSICQPFQSGLVDPGLVCDPAAATQEQRRPPDVDGSVAHQATLHGVRIASCPAPAQNMCSTGCSPENIPTSWSVNVPIQGGPTQEQSQLPDARGSDTPQQPYILCPAVVTSMGTYVETCGSPGRGTQEQRRPPDVDDSVAHQATLRGVRIPSCPAPARDMCSTRCSPEKSEVDQTRKAVAEAEALVFQLFGSGLPLEGDGDGVERVGDAKDHDI